MVESSRLNTKALDIWYAAHKEYLRHGDIHRICAVIEAALKENANSERERIATYLENRYNYFPHIAKEAREL